MLCRFGLRKGRIARLAIASAESKTYYPSALLGLAIPEALHGTMGAEDKRWDDQEINYATETKFPEIIHATLIIPRWAEKFRGTFLKLDQVKLDALLESGEFPEKMRGARIDRVCLYFRLFCRLGPGGDHYPALGVMHWYRVESLYAIFYFSPTNDWLQVMVLAGEAPG